MKIHFFKNYDDCFSLVKIGRFEIWFGGISHWNITNGHSLYLGKLNIEYA